MYSQNEEEKFINEHLLDNGNFLDVGAWDGKTYSNTLKLYERGWSGVLVEPSPSSFKALQKTYNGLPRVKLVNAAVGETCGEIDFYDAAGDAIGSTSVSHKEKWENGKYKCKFNKIKVDSINFSELFKNYGTDYQMVNIDTENTNWEVLQLFPFSVCKPLVICVEYDNMKNEMETYLSQFGYKTLYTSGENIVCYRGV